MRPFECLTSFTFPKNSLADLCSHRLSRSPYAVHQHPPAAAPAAAPQGMPGAIPADVPGPTEGMSTERMNEMYLAQNQARSDRLEADSRGYDTVFAQ